MQWLIIELKFNIFITVTHGVINTQLVRIFGMRKIFFIPIVQYVSYIIKLCSIRMACEVLEWFFQMAVSPFYIDSHVPIHHRGLIPFIERYVFGTKLLSCFDPFSTPVFKVILSSYNKMAFTSLVFYGVLWSEQQCYYTAWLIISTIVSRQITAQSLICTITRVFSLLYRYWCNMCKFSFIFWSQMLCTYNYYN